LAGKNISGIAPSSLMLMDLATRHILLSSHKFQFRNTLDEQSNPTVTMNKNPIFAILWLLLLFFIAWPVATFCAGIWIFLQVRPSHLKKKKSIVDHRTALCRAFAHFFHVHRCSLSPSLSYCFLTIQLH
jgi:hypothetical protein